ncbi:hypothetical protein QVD17_33183 [Tagetes erecta]|uniref:beta-ketoacyl-[acyl-carrier-protein] synthase I n=1 Tax=Tagetes erecta TaxID=13708 RepID=A0AAD8K2Y8_TARER|nr:hypothetical protein QVD17_33183 [Tagetes erecta]
MQAQPILLLTPLRVSPLRLRHHSFPTNVESTRAPRIPTVVMSATAPKREKDPKKRVVITGMGVVSVFGNNVNTYYDNLLAGESGIGLIDKFDTSEFPIRFAGQIRGFTSDGYIDEKNDRRLEDYLRYCIVAGKKALEDADLGGNKLSKVCDSLGKRLIITDLGVLAAVD